MESLGLRATAAPGFFVCCRRNERKEKWCVFLLLLQNKVNKGKNIALFVAEREIFLYLCYVLMQVVYGDCHSFPRWCKLREI